MISEAWERMETDPKTLIFSAVIIIGIVFFLIMLATVGWAFQISILVLASLAGIAVMVRKVVG